MGRATVPGDKPASAQGKAPVISAPADKPAAEVRVTAEPPRAAAAPTAGTSGATDRPVDVRSVLSTTMPPESQGEKPKFTRAPGMPPPPDDLGSDESAGPRMPAAKASGSAKVAAGIATGVAAARNPVNAEATVGIRVPTAAAPASADATAPVSTGAAAPATGSARVQAGGPRTGRVGLPAGGSRGSRRARLHLKRVDPWSVMKFSFAVSLVLFIVIVIATAVLYVALDTMGVFEAVNKAIGQINPDGSQGASPIKISASGVLLAAVLIGGVNTVLFTALSTLGAFIYNVCADLVGGIELTLAEKD